jgi:hypothetical protein
MTTRLKFGLRWKLNLLIGAVLLVTMIMFEGMSLHHERAVNRRARPSPSGAGAKEGLCQGYFGYWCLVHSFTS